MLRSIAQFRRVTKGSGLLGRAEKLELRGHLPEARVALLEALDLVESIQGDMLKAMASSVRLSVITALARIAATMKDGMEAKLFARKGLALWSEFRLSVPSTRNVEAFKQWESWARSYLNAAAEAPCEPSMKLDIPAAPTYGPMVRLYGHDGHVIKVLREVLKGLSRGPLVLHSVPGIGAVDGCHVALALADKGRGLRRIGATSFVWEEDGPGWDRVAGLLEPFESLSPEEARFQFLSQGGDVSMLISSDGRW